MARVTKLLATAAAVATVMGMASGANAAIVASSSANENYGTDLSNFSGAGLVICDLETAGARCNDPGVTVTLGANSLFQSAPGGAAVPPGDGTTFLAVLGGGSATLSVAAGRVITGLSFFLGSPDGFNAVSFFNGAVQVGPTIFGSTFGGPFAGDQSIGERVTFNGADGALGINSVVFTSGSTAMELDRIFVTTAPVPEPATWAMMILGMGMVGFGLRMRRRSLATAA